MIHWNLKRVPILPIYLQNKPSFLLLVPIIEIRIGYSLATVPNPQEQILLSKEVFQLCCIIRIMWVYERVQVGAWCQSYPLSWKKTRIRYMFKSLWMTAITGSNFCGTMLFTWRTFFYQRNRNVAWRDLQIVFLIRLGIIFLIFGPSAISVIVLLPITIKANFQILGLTNSTDNSLPSPPVTWTEWSHICKFDCELFERHLRPLSIPPSQKNSKLLPRSF